MNIHWSIFTRLTKCAFVCGCFRVFGQYLKSETNKKYINMMVSSGDYSDAIYSVVHYLHVIYQPLFIRSPGYEDCSWPQLVGEEGDIRY